MGAMDMIARAGLGSAKARQADHPAPQPVTPLKLCIDCKHYFLSHNDTRQLCMRPVLSLVDGWGTPLEQACSYERRPGGGCGPEGAYWEQK